MPIYEYLCAACGHQLDALQRLSDEVLVHCPHCGAPELKRQLSAPRFRLKGSGWYETDFKSDKRRNIAESDSASGGSAASADSAKSADKSESKPGKAADAKPAPAAAEKKPGAGKADSVA